MGDRTAEYLNFTIMLVAVVAVIGIGTTFMVMGRGMQNEFYDGVVNINTASVQGELLSVASSDYTEMSAASALNFLYANRTYIYDVYDDRLITSQTFSSAAGNIGQLTGITHTNIGGRNTTLYTDSSEKFRQATNYFVTDLNKTVKVSARINPANTDYYDIYIHDVDCMSKDAYHTGNCKSCNQGTNHTTACHFTYK